MLRCAAHDVFWLQVQKELDESGGTGDRGTGLGASGP